MYEIILKWGLDTITTLTKSKAENEASSVVGTEKQKNAIVLETIRAKNALVMERFKHAKEACNDIVALIDDIDKTMADWEAARTDREAEPGDRSNKHPSREIIIDDVFYTYHSSFYRRFRTIRSKFEGSNDLLAAYSLVFLRLIDRKTVERLCIRTNSYTARSISACYKRSWSLLADVLTRLVRIGSTDPRYWLSDYPYACHIIDWAAGDCDSASDWLSENKAETAYFMISLEKPGELDALWQKVKGRCELAQEISDQ